MRVAVAWVSVFFGVGAYATPPQAEPRVEPVIVSLDPFTVQSGTTVVAALRGTGLRGAKAGFIETPGMTISVDPSVVAPPQENAPKGKAATDVVQLRIQVAAAVKPGRYPFRLITANGVSNSLSVHITGQPITAEPAGPHDNPQNAVAIGSFPSLFTGKISQRGEADYYQFRATAGQTLTFNVFSGLPQTAAGGSGATIANFDPSLTIYEAGGSWLDPQRLKRIAYNDEPAFVFGRSTDVHLAHRFERSGLYWLRVEAFAGQGGPHYSYQLRVLPGAVPEEPQPASDSWDERIYSRRLAAGRLNELAARGGAKPDLPSIETYRASPENSPKLRLPATVEGAILQPGETHRSQFQVDGPRDLAIEIETPTAAPPFFNPIVRLLNAQGEEVATNVFAGRGACSGALSKSLQSKALIPLREAGSYTMEIRDATADHAGASFQYRVQVRQQVPHLGQVRIDSDHINLAAGEAKTIRVVFDREEDYRGAVAVMAEALPPGVQALVGADFEPDKDPPSTIGKRDRYVPRTERMVVVFTASAEAAASLEPQMARIVVRPVAGGKLGDPVASKTIPMMVVTKP